MKKLMLVVMMRRPSMAAVPLRRQNLMNILEFPDFKAVSTMVVIMALTMIIIMNYSVQAEWILLLSI